MDMRAFAVLALAAVLAAAAGAAATEASVDAHELAGSCDDGRKAPVMLVDKLPGGGAPCCKGSLCPLVGGVCCPGSTHCCPSGTKCAPLRGHGEGQKCSVSGFHASAHPEALAAEQRRRAEAPEPPPALHVQIVQARSVKQMTREQLAREVGITAQKMLEYELAEEAPPADVLNRISQTLGVTLIPAATANGEEEKEDFVPVAQRAPIAVAIEEARKGRSLSRKELGAAVGVSEAQVLSFEDGSAKPTQKEADRIGAALNADMPDPNLPAPVNVPDLSKVLPNLRQKRGLSVGKLARVAGIRPAVVRGMENGKVVPTKQLRERLDKALDANLEQATKPVMDQAAGVTLEAEAVPDSGSASSSTSSSGPDGTDTDGSEASGAGSDGGDDDDASSSDEAGASGSGSASDSEDRQAFTQSTEEKAEKKADDERASAKKAEAEAKQVQQAAAKQQAAATKKEQPAKEQPKQAAASKGAAVKGDARSALMGALGKAASGDGGKAAAASDAETAARAAAAATRQAAGKPQNSKEAQRAAELRRIAQDEKVADAVAAKKAADEKEAADERARQNSEQAAAHAKADALRAATEASKQRVQQLAKEAAASRANLARATSEAQGALKTARDATKAAGSDEGRAKAAVLLRAAQERAAKARAAHAKATAAKARAAAAHRLKVAQLAAARRKAAQAKARHDAAVKRAYQWVRTGPLVQLRVAYASQFCLSAARPRGAAGRPSAGDPVRAAACGSAANKWRLGRDRTVRPAHNLRLCLESHARRTLHLAPCKRGQASQRFVKAGHLLRGAHGCVRAPRNLVTGQLARSGKCTGWRARVVPVRPGSPQPTPARRWLTRLPRSKSRRRCVESAARNARFLTCDKRNRRLQWRAYPDRTVRPAFAPNLCLDARGGSGRPARALPCAPRVASQRWVHSRSGRLRSASGLYLFHRSPAAPKHGEPLLLGRFPNAKAARRAAPLRWRRVGAGFGAPKRAARRAQPAGKRAKKAGKAAGGKKLKKSSKVAKKVRKTKKKKKAPERRVGVYVSGPAGLRPAGRVRLSPRVSFAGRSTLRVEAMSARPFTGAAAGGLRLARNTWYVVQLVGRVDPRSSKGALVCPRVAASGSKFAAFRCLKGTSLQRGRYHKVNVVFRTPARDDSYTVGAVMKNQRGGDAFYLVDLAVVRLGRSRRPSRARGSTAVVARFGGGVAPLAVRGRAQVRTTPDSDGLTLTLSRPWRKNVALAARELDLVKGRTYEVVLRGRLARGPGLACSFVSLGKRAVSRGCSKALSLRVNASKDSAVVQRFVAPATGRATVGVRLVKHNSATVARVRALVVREVRK